MTRAKGSGQAAGLVLLSLAAVVAFQPYLRGSSLRLVAGTLLVFFLPGYALQTVLFPIAGEERLSSRTRLAVSIGSSPALVALVALVVNELTGRIAFGRLLTALVLVTGGLLGVSVLQTLGTSRRASQPTADGGWTPRRQVTDRLPRPTLSVVLGGGSRRQWALVGVATILFVGLLAAPAPQQTYTELSLLTETEQGRLTADDYPETLAPEASADLVVTVRNEEQTAQDYTLVITREQADGGGVILAAERVELADGETRRLRTALVAPETPGEVRFTYRLYRTETVASVDSVENLPSPYRETRLLLTVRPSPEGDA
ncbi:DUF1616 domain-containing protein [Salinirubellus salinus]